MPCYHPQYRLDARVPERIPRYFRQRIYNKGVILSQAEYERDREFLQRFEEAGLLSQIPCGKCVGCRLDYSREWANRCMHEASYYSSNLFLTLTYDETTLPIGTDVLFDPDTGEIVLDEETGQVKTVQRGVLVPRDLQLFLKSFRIELQRKYGQTGVRFYACGEYGEEGLRPHFHVIAFNCELPDMVYWYRRNGMTYYVSEFLLKVWQKGICAVTEVNWNTCAYVARYVMKKRKGKMNKSLQEMRERVGVQFQDEFVRMSLKPGIGWQYYQDHKDTIYKTDEDFVQKKDRTVKVKPAKYFDRLFDLDDPDRMFEIKQERRAKGKARSEQIRMVSDLSQIELLEIKERTAESQAVRLLRRFYSGSL